jgi:hypothetical protein
MAYTAPTNFTAGQTLTAAQLNAVQANIAALYAIEANTQSTHFTTTSWQSALNLNWQDVTNFSVAITPSLSTSKVLVLATVHFGSTVTAGTNINARITRNGTVLPYIAARNVYQQAEWGLLQIAYLDSPASTSAQTYQVQILGSNGNTNYTYVNLRGDGAATATSSIVVREVPV